MSGSMSGPKSGLGQRLRDLRAALGETQKSMSSRLGLGETTWQSYERGLNKPGAETLEKVAALGFSVDWLLTGRGAMRPNLLPPLPSSLPSPSAAPSPPGNGATGSGLGSSIGGAGATDPETLGRVWEGVTAVYRAENQRIAPKDQARIVAGLHDRLVAIADAAERRGALRYALDRLREELRQAADDPTTGKRLA